MKSRRTLVVSAAVVMAIAGLRVSAQDVRSTTDSPTATVTSLQQGLIAVARERSVEDRYKALEPPILATHNLPYIAEFALRRQWSSLTDADRQRFVAAFQRLSVTTYAARFKSVGPETFRAIAAGPADASGRVRVSTAVAREGQPDVSLEYLLEQDEQGFRIINIVADGVSDLALKRAEYQRLFASGGLDGLIAELEQQTQRLTSN